MTDWLKGNAWSLIIAIVGVASTFTIYGYRIEALEKQVIENKASIALLNTGQVNLQLQLAGISSDIKYIKEALDRFIQ